VTGQYPRPSYTEGGPGRGVFGFEDDKGNRSKEWGAAVHRVWASHAEGGSGRWPTMAPPFNIRNLRTP